MDFRMQGQLTARAHLAMRLAAREARALGAPSICTGHVLLGLLLEEESTAARVLSEHGVTPGAVRAVLRRSDASGAAEGDRLALSETATRVLRRAEQEAHWLGLEHAATEHLLLALLHEDDGDPVRLLLGAGVQAEELHAEVVHRSLRKRTQGSP
jgi:ATP-dependent Clp protease ATP-binding subunit ClpC